MNQEVYAYFTDVEKAFIRVRYKKLIHLLKSKNVDSRDIRIVSNLYSK